MQELCPKKDPNPGKCMEEALDRGFLLTTESQLIQTYKMKYVDS